MRGGGCVVGIVVVSHGPLAEGLKGAAEMIVGAQPQFLALGMDPAADVDALRAEIEAAADQVRDDGGVLVLVDLMGGSPANASAYLAVAGTPIVCGANLPMLLEILVQRASSSAQELAELVTTSGREGVVNLGQRLLTGG